MSQTTDSGWWKKESNTDGFTLRDEDHEFNDGWKWSAALTEFVERKISGRSLKIGVGKVPIGDVNFDIADLNQLASEPEAPFSVADIESDDIEAESIQDAIVADSDAEVYGKIQSDPPAEATHPVYDLLGGYAVRGDIFEQPFAFDTDRDSSRNGFQTVIVDPPWKGLSRSERRSIFEAALSATAVGGQIVFNATWMPEEGPTSRHYDTRFRMQGDAFGGTSLLVFYRKTANDVEELFDAYVDESDIYTTDENGTIIDAQSGKPCSIKSGLRFCDLSPQYNTDPKLASGADSYHCCPMCGSSTLNQLRDEFHGYEGEYQEYECASCQFRVNRKEVTKLAEAIQRKMTNQDIDSLANISTIEYTPEDVRHHLECNVAGEYPDKSLPWVPDSSEEDEKTEGKQSVDSKEYMSLREFTNDGNTAEKA